MLSPSGEEAAIEMQQDLSMCLGKCVLGCSPVYNCSVHSYPSRASSRAIELSCAVTRVESSCSSLCRRVWKYLSRLGVLENTDVLLWKCKHQQADSRMLSQTVPSCWSALLCLTHPPSLLCPSTSPSVSALVHCSGLLHGFQGAG